MISRCPMCGREVSADAVDGLCLRCLFGAASKPPEEPASLGSIRYFGDYELAQEIARGGMGIVFRAVQLSLNRPVALKVISAGPLASPEMVQRFRTEAEAAANLDHPNIVPIYEIGEHEGQHYFSMQLIEGPSLAAKLRDGPLAPVTAARLLVGVARAVQHAHERGVLHRDLKPANILLRNGSAPCVTDFGLAKIVQRDSQVTQTAATLGTPSYFAPEQARGATRNVTTAADVYGLGAILYESLTGQPPFRGDSTFQVIQDVLRKEASSLRELNPACPRDLETVCLKCLQKEPAGRYASAAALADDLERWLRHEPIQARPATVAARFGKWIRRHPTIFVAAVLLSCTVIAGVTGVFLQWRQAERAREEAVAESSRANIGLANMHLDRGDVNAAKALLLAMPERYRNWEWGYLIGQCYSEAWAARAWNEQRSHERFGEPRLAFSPDGQWLAAWSDKRAVLLAVTNGALVHDLTKFYEESRGRYEFASFSADSKRLLINRQRGKVLHLSDGSFHEVPLNLGFHIAPAEHGQAFTWDSYRPGDVPAIAGQTVKTNADGIAGPTVQRIDYLNSNVVQRFELPGDIYARPFVSPDRRLIVTVRALWPHNNRPFVPEIYVYDAASGALVRTVRPLPNREVPLRLATDEFGEQAAAMYADGSIHVFDVPRTNTLFVVPADPNRAPPADATSIELCKRGERRWLLIRSPTGRLSVLSGENGIELFTLPERTDIYRVSPSGEHIVTFRRDWSATVWRMKDGSKARSLPGHTELLVDAQFSPDGEQIATLDEGGEVKLWPVSRGTQLIECPEGGVATGTVFSPDGTKVAFAFRDRVVRVRDVLSGKVVQILRGSRQWLLDVDWSRDGKWIAATGADRAVAVWSAESGEIKHVFHGMDGIGEVVAFSPDSREIAAASADGVVRVWDLRSGTLVHTQSGTGEEGSTVGWSPDGRYLARASLANNVLVWERSTGKPILEGKPARVLSWHPNGGSVVTGGADGEINLWPIDKAGPARTWKGRGQIRGLRFLPDGTRLFVARTEALLELGRPAMEVIDPRSEDGRIILNFGATEMVFLSSAYSPGIRTICTGGDGFAALWQAFPWETGAYGAGPLDKAIRTYADDHWRRRTEALPAQLRVSSGLPVKWPLRDSDAPLNTLDLEPHFNASLDVCWVPYGNTLQVRSDFRLIPPGIYTNPPPGWMFPDVEDHGPVDAPAFDIRGLVVLGGGTNESPELQRFYPDAIRDIAIGRTARQLHFLHGTARERGPVLLGRYLVRYTDGTSAEIPLQFWENGNINTWTVRWQSNREKILWWRNGPTPHRAIDPVVHLYTWENPHPDKIIQKLDIESYKTGDYFYLMALTAE